MKISVGPMHNQSRNGRELFFFFCFLVLFCLVLVLVFCSIYFIPWRKFRSPSIATTTGSTRAALPSPMSVSDFILSVVVSRWNGKYQSIFWRLRSTIRHCLTTVGQNTQLLWEKTDLDLTVGQYLVSDEKSAC